MMRSALHSFALVLAVTSFGSLAHAHVGVQGAGAYAGSSFEATFGVGHGCEGLDTYSVRIRIPAGVTNIRVLEHGSFASAVIERDDAQVVQAVTFTKAQSAVRAADDAYYKLVVRMTLPATPFTTLYFPTTQVCKSADGATTKTTEWIAETAGHGHEPDAGGMKPREPAPSLLLLPPRHAGWNKYTTGEGVHLHDLPAVFKDALIVWADNAAFSVNPTTAAQIEAEEDVEVLDAIHPGTEIWVKY